MGLVGFVCAVCVLQKKNVDPEMAELILKMKNLLKKKAFLMEKQFKHYINTVAITIDYAKEILEYLSSKYKVYATSNATYEQQISRLKNADFDKYFSGYFIKNH